MLTQKSAGSLLTLCVVCMTGCGDDGGSARPEILPTPAEPSSVASPTSAADDVPARDEHHYFHKTAQAHAAEWGYDGDAGPGHWADLSPEYALAKTGQQQSPIDIAGAVSQDLPGIQFDYHPSQIDLVYNGHTVEEIEDKRSAMNVDDSHFVLQQFHFHGPSEHTVDGKHTAMEMHLVHKDADGKIAVIGVLIEEGADNPAFDAVWDYLPDATNRERIETVTVDAASLLPRDHSYYRYTGSFTTPPCTEDVLWMVLKTPVELSASQIEKFRAVISGNNRPVQPLNGRPLAVSAE